MNKLLLGSIKVEYETTDITITQLLVKYNCTRKDLRGYTKWVKHSSDSQKDTNTPPRDSKVSKQPNKKQVSSSSPHSATDTDDTIDVLQPETIIDSEPAHSDDLVFTPLPSELPLVGGVSNETTDVELDTSPFSTPASESMDIYEASSQLYSQTVTKSPALSDTEIKETINKVASNLLLSIDNLAQEGIMSPKDVKDLSGSLTNIKESILGSAPTIQVNINNTNTVVNSIRELIQTTPNDC